ncbi:MAG: hypothetical protein KBE50_03115, partial [Fervidobacterium sp.]|nr:hypothetical protein [Fervidobacterium sp.]
YEPGLCGIEYRVYGTILRQEISKSNCNENYEIMKLQDEKSIPNARPIMNNFRTTFVRTQR